MQDCGDDAVEDVKFVYSMTFPQSCFFLMGKVHAIASGSPAPGRFDREKGSSALSMERQRAISRQRGLGSRTLRGGS
jgi:hypothetical protein